MARATVVGVALALLTLVPASAAAAPGSGTFGFDGMDFEGAATAQAIAPNVLVGPREGPGSLGLGHAAVVELPDGRVVRDATVVLHAAGPRSLEVRPAGAAALDSTAGHLSVHPEGLALGVEPTRFSSNGDALLVLTAGTLAVRAPDGQVVNVHSRDAAEPAHVGLKGAALDARFPPSWAAVLVAPAIGLVLDGQLRMLRAQGEWDDAQVAGTFVRSGRMTMQARFVPGETGTSTASAPASELADLLRDGLRLPARAREASLASGHRGARVAATLADVEPAAAQAASAAPLPIAELALATALVLAFALALKKSKGLAFLAALGSRIRGEEARRHPGRERILSLLREHPGMRLAELERATGMTRNTVEYHLVLLKRCGLVEVQSRYGSTRYFVRGHSSLDDVRLAQAVLRRARLSGEILRAVEERPGVSVSEVSQRLCLHPSHTMYHLRKLLAARLVDARKEGRTRKLYPFGHLGQAAAAATVPPPGT